MRDELYRSWPASFHGQFSKHQYQESSLRNGPAGWVLWLSLWANHTSRKFLRSTCLEILLVWGAQDPIYHVPVSFPQNSEDKLSSLLLLKWPYLACTKKSMGLTVSCSFLFPYLDKHLGIFEWPSHSRKIQGSWTQLGCRIPQRYLSPFTSLAFYIELRSPNITPGRSVRDKWNQRHQAFMTICKLHNRGCQCDWEALNSQKVVLRQQAPQKLGKMVKIFKLGWCCIAEHLQLLHNPIHAWLL